MNEIIQSLEVNATNGTENFCYISEKKLNAIKELSKREQQENLQKENKRLKNIETSLIFIKNRVKQGMTQENINKCAIDFVNSYLKDSDIK